MNRDQDGYESADDPDYELHSTATAEEIWRPPERPKRKANNVPDAPHRDSPGLSHQRVRETPSLSPGQALSPGAPCLALRTYTCVPIQSSRSARGGEGQASGRDRAVRGCAGPSQPLPDWQALPTDVLSLVLLAACRHSALPAAASGACVGSLMMARARPSQQAPLPPAKP